MARNQPPARNNTTHVRKCGSHLAAPLRMVLTTNHLCSRWLPMARPSETCRGSHSENALKNEKPNRAGESWQTDRQISRARAWPEGHCSLPKLVGHWRARLRRSAQKVFAPHIFRRRIADCPTALTCLCGPHYRTLLRARAWRIAHIVGHGYAETQNSLQKTRFEATRTRTAGESCGLSWPSVRDIVACTYRTTIAHR